MTAAVPHAIRNISTTDATNNAFTGRLPSTAPRVVSGSVADPAQIPPGPLFPGVSFDPNGPALFTAIQEQLGLKLEAARAPVDVLVIEQARFAREN
jgi:uncharacterized protein (TIGR03435 family)